MRFRQLSETGVTWARRRLRDLPNDVKRGLRFGWHLARQLLLYLLDALRTELAFALAAVLLLVLVGGISWSLLRVEDAADPGASVDAISHDGRQHEMALYLCIPREGSVVTGTLLAKRSASHYLNLRLPGPSGDRTSLGFLEKAVKHVPGALPPCVQDSEAEALLRADVSRRLLHLFAEKSGVITKSHRGLAPFLVLPPPYALEAANAGFDELLAPSDDEEHVPVSFKWQGVQERSFSERYLRLAFGQPRPLRTGERYELPHVAKVFLPPGLSVISGPSAMVLGFSSRGVKIVEIPISQQTRAIELAWRDEDRETNRTTILILLAVLLGTAASAIVNLLFGLPRWSNR